MQTSKKNINNGQFIRVRGERRFPLSGPLSLCRNRGLLRLSYTFCLMIDLNFKLGSDATDRMKEATSQAHEIN